MTQTAPIPPSRPAEPEATAEGVIAVYDRHGPAWAESRDRRLVERRWLDRFLAVAPRPGARKRVLDLGCGAGRPIAEYLVDRGVALAGVDASLPMMHLFQRVVPEARAFHIDMRGLDLQEHFDGILAWDSFFHLAATDQRGMMMTFARHAAPGAALMFTSGPEAGIAIGAVEETPVFHESLSPEEYRDLLGRAGFKSIEFRPEDPDCGGRSIWLCRFGIVTGG